MSWLSSFINSFKPVAPPPLPAAPVMPSYTPPAAPSLPQLPPIILNAPAPQPAAVMPTLGSAGVSAAGKAATMAAQNRNGRASTILTSKKKKKQGGGESNIEPNSVALT